MDNTKILKELFNMNYLYCKYQEKFFRTYDFWNVLFLTDVDNAFLVLKCFHQRGVEFYDVHGLYGFATRANRFDIVKWIHENLKKLPLPTINEVFYPLFEQSELNVEMAYYFFDTFPRFMSDDTLNGLLLTGYPWVGPNPYTKDNVAALKLICNIHQRPDLKIYLVDPISWSDVMTCACSYRAYECMEFLNKEFEFELTYVVVEYALVTNDIKLLQWLIQNRKEFQDGRVKIPKFVYNFDCKESIRKYIVENFVLE